MFRKKKNLDKLVFDLSGNREAIIECRFDSTLGEWVYHKIRHDKSYPNNFSSFLQILEIISENLSKEDIIKVFGTDIPKIDGLQPEINNNSVTIPKENNESESEVIYESPLKKNEEESHSNSPVIIGVKRKVDYYIDESSDIISLEHVPKKSRPNSYLTNQ